MVLLVSTLLVFNKYLSLKVFTEGQNSTIYFAMRILILSVSVFLFYPLRLWRCFCEFLSSAETMWWILLLKMGQPIRGPIQIRFFVLHCFLQVIFEVTYVGLVHYYFITLRINYSDLILEHVSCASLGFW